ncbi:transglutaminase TgpA family protein [Halopseudomonas sabulinigri]|uniref:Protein-glutamine gamma-glutamyltransferase TgpA n=1 Tax=Halopseudomonas sabulinigri TaxID=472181 RepID=A0ABP9ZLM8_9GAMM
MSAAGLIPRNSLAWLLTAQVVVLLPHLPRLPWWVALLWIGCALWRVQVQRMRWGYPGIVLKATALVLILVGVFLTQGTLIGLDATVMWLLMLFMLKLLEMRTPRDALVVIYLGFFVLATAFLFDQGIPLTLYQCLSLLILVAALVGLQQSAGRNDPLRALRSAGVMLLQAIPLLLVLFIFFPRLEPLWSVNMPGGSAKTGLSDNMSPADIANLARSPELAFRASFTDQIPPLPTLYWRALTLSRFDGRSWSQDRWLNNLPALELDTSGQAVEYQVVAGASGQHWVYSLRGAISEDPRLRRMHDYNLQSIAPLNSTFGYSATSYPQALLQNEPLSALERNRQTELPEQGDPRARAWAAELREQYPDDAALVQSVLRYFNQQPFIYTLNPTPLGQHSNDEFLFDTLRGFCEHYAGAMTFVLRAAGIPARVVAGYQGGEVNTRGGYVLVHQFDAHAWVEAWLPGQGWVTVDPTFQVAPERIERGLEEAVRGEGSFLQDDYLSASRYRGVTWLNEARLAWDNINYQWQLRVLNFKGEEQMGLFRRWLGTADWQRIGLVVLALAGGVMLLQGLWWFRPQRRSGTAQQRAWASLNQRLTRLRLQALPGEGPRDWQRRLEVALPAQKSRLQAFFDEFVRQSYATAAGGSRADQQRLQQVLRELLRSLPRKRPAAASVLLRDGELSSSTKPL